MPQNNKKKIFILGAGVAGLAAGWKLSQSGFEVHVIEKNSFIGGMASSFKYKNFTLDYGPHKIFSLLKEVQTEILRLLGEQDVLKIKKKSRIYLNGKFLNYPVEFTDLLKNLGALTCFLCGLSFAKADLIPSFHVRPDKSFDDWVTNRFGSKLNSLIFKPYAQKIWGDPKKLAVELASTRIAAPTLWEIFKQMILKIPSKAVINADYFYYPKYGVQEIPKKMAEQIKRNKGDIQTRQNIRQINIKNNKIIQFVFDNGRIMKLGDNDIVISTIPIPVFLNLLKPKRPNKVISTAKKLRTRNLILFYLILNKPHLTDDSWLFFPESEYLFNRIFEQKNFSKYIIPRDKTTLCLEITCAEKDATWNKSTNEIYKIVISQLQKIGLVEEKDVEAFFDKRLKFAYPIYDLGFRQNLSHLYNYLDGIKNLYTIGRQGAFGYTGTLDSIDMGITAANHIAQDDGKNDWNKVRERFSSYIVVD